VKTAQRHGPDTPVLLDKIVGGGSKLQRNISTSQWHSSTTSTNAAYAIRLEAAWVKYQKAGTAAPTSFVANWFKPHLQAAHFHKLIPMLRLLCQALSPTETLPIVGVGERFNEPRWAERITKPSLTAYFGVPYMKSVTNSTEACNDATLHPSQLQQGHTTLLHFNTASNTHDRSDAG
jgi:hypothetical protein